MGIHAKDQSGITEEQFNQAIDEAEKIYASIITEKGGNLKVNRLWENGTVNASAQRQGKNWVVNMYGGLARHETITLDGFRLVICHEIGHHIGGTPQKKSFFSIWASNEGQADYFSTLKCLRRMFDGADNASVLASMEVDPTVQQQCTARHNGKSSQEICMRGAMAGMSVSNLFQALRNEERKPAFAEPDTAVVDATNDNHPATQCRLDTYFGGATCDASVNDDVSNTDVQAGTCERANYDLGARPRCWFKF
ncbi:MAG: hypothetical protein COT74_13015 [Bdellovibrionales bacterium CG10_big_fil_rev_8_21_14_0_10_45_34]|nr:MAG: hypothetical protein COT74_13015 [Bdellovibrionales bacterium CG10_big_fil_rev_8_21_14_0_10_45_34]